MTPDELRALADVLADECALRLIAGGKNHEEAQACEQAADYLRQCADEKPAVWVDSIARPQPHAVTKLTYRSAHDARDGVEYVPLYTHPAPAAPQAEPKREPCIGSDPACPCQDGDPCHYRDAADGTQAWPIPQAGPKREPLSDDKIEEFWEAASSDDGDAFDVHGFARMIERAHGIGGSDAEATVPAKE